MSDTEGTAAARPEDYVREFMRQLEHPETVLRTDTRLDASGVWAGTSWGADGKAAILVALCPGARPMTSPTSPSPPVEAAEAYRRGAEGARMAVAMTADDGPAAQIETLVAMVARLSEQSYEYRAALRPFAEAYRFWAPKTHHLTVLSILRKDLARAAELVPEQTT